MSLISGSGGGIKTKSFKKSGIVEINDFEELKCAQKIQEIGIFINNTCNLDCPYCYVKELSDNTEEIISNEQWLSFLTEAINDSVRTLSIVGKEPFMTPEATIDLLQKLNGETNKGLVSNLTLMTPEIARQLSDIKNLYIDVSIDGLPSIHDRNRGNGSFEKTIRGMEYLKDAGITNIFVSHLLYKDNAETFCNFIAFCEKYDLKKFSVFPLCDFGDKDKSPLSMSGNEYCNIIEMIMNNTLKISDTEIIFKTDYTEPEIMLSVVDRFVRRDKIREDENGVLYDVYSDKNHNTFYFNFSPFPLEFVSALRINHRGSVTFCANMNDEIINIRDGYNAVKECINSQEVEVFYQKYFNKMRSMVTN